MSNATQIATRTADAAELVTDIYVESGIDWNALHEAALAEQNLYGIGAEECGAVQAWNNAHADLAEKISDTLETLDIPAGGPVDTGLYCIGDVDVYLASEYSGIYDLSHIEEAIKAAIRTVVEDQAWEAETELALAEEELREAREAQEHDDWVRGNDW